MGAGLDAVASSAGPAHAVIGVGNPASSNACANEGGARAAGARVSSKETLAGNAGQLPLGLPRNHCGNSGLTCATNTATIDDVISDVISESSATSKATSNRRSTRATSSAPPSSSGSGRPGVEGSCQLGDLGAVSRFHLGRRVPESDP